MILYKAPNTEGVLHGAQGKDPLAVHAGEGGNRRFRAGGEDQLVIGLRIELAAVQRVNGDGFPLGVDGRHLLPHPHVNAETVPKNSPEFAASVLPAL